MLSHAGKIFASILQRRILKKTEEILSESQAGFRPGRSTVDQLFTLRQIAEKHLEKNKSLFCCYIDFEKAFDSIWQEGLWKAMRFFGYSNKHICLLKALQNLIERSQGEWRTYRLVSNNCGCTSGLCIITTAIQHHPRNGYAACHL